MSNSWDREDEVFGLIKEKTNYYGLIDSFSLWVKAKPIEERANVVEWYEVLNECFYRFETSIFQSVHRSIYELVTRSDFLLSLTAYENQLAIKFFLRFVENKKYLRIDEIESSNKLIVLCGILAKYPGMQIRSLEEGIKELPSKPDKDCFDELFHHLFTKYERLNYLVRHFEFLSRDEIHAMMEILRGQSPNSLTILRSRLSKKEVYNFLFALSDDWDFDDHIFLRGIILAKIMFSNNTEMAHRIVRDSTEFQFNPERFFDDIEFWKKAISLILGMDRNIGFWAGPILDFLAYSRMHDPNFTLKGRTPKSLLRLNNEWHEEVHRKEHEGFTRTHWQRSEIPDQLIEYRKVNYAFVELTSGKQLASEGEALQHCVVSYAYHCLSGQTQIWSMRAKRGKREIPSITIQTQNGTIVQARGLENRNPSKVEFEAIKIWAKVVDLKIDPEILSESEYFY